MRGSIPYISAVAAELMAISASCCAFGSGLTAQSPYTSTRSARHIKKTLDTTVKPGWAPIIRRAGRIVSAVV